MSVVVPTVTGREEHLRRCVEGYYTRSPGVKLDMIIVPDKPTCGIAWQIGSQRAKGDYLHLSADDIVPGEGWFEPMAEAADKGMVPVALVVTCTPDVLDDEQMPLAGNPLPAVPNANFFEGHPPADPLGETADWSQASGPGHYPSIPFCSMEQWQTIGPMIASHYGTDHWFGERAWAAGFPNVVRHGPVFYHYAAQAGRVPTAAGWMHVDRLTFDTCIAYPAYMTGALDPAKLHPEHDTLVGREMARAWYRAAVPPPFPWDATDLEEQYR